VPAQGRRLVYESGQWEVDLDRRELRARGARAQTCAVLSAEAGQNYIVPVDAELTTPAALEFEMVRLDLVHRIMEREAQTNIVSVIVGVGDNREDFGTAQGGCTSPRAGCCRLQSSDSTIRRLATMLDSRRSRHPSGLSPARPLVMMPPTSNCRLA
jgi:hypothetical protein